MRGRRLWHQPITASLLPVASSLTPRNLPWRSGCGRPVAFARGTSSWLLARSLHHKKTERSCRWVPYGACLSPVNSFSLNWGSAPPLLPALHSTAAIWAVIFILPLLRQSVRRLVRAKTYPLHCVFNIRQTLALARSIPAWTRSGSISQSTYPTDEYVTKEKHHDRPIRRRRRYCKRHEDRSQ